MFPRPRTISLALVLPLALLLILAPPCPAQALREHLLAIPSVGTDGPLAEEENAARRLMSREYSRSESFPELAGLIAHDPAFAAGQTARFCAFVCLLPTSRDMNGVVTITDPMHLDFLLRAALEEPTDNRRGRRTRGLILDSLDRVDPALVPRVNEAIPILLQDEEPGVIHSVISLIQTRDVEPEPFVGTMRDIAESPETAIPAAWRTNRQRREEARQRDGNDTTLQRWSDAHYGVYLREAAAMVVLRKGGAIDEDIARVSALDEDTRLAYAFALASVTDLPDSPVFSCTPETQTTIAMLIGDAVADWGRDFPYGFERGEGLRAFIASENVAPEARRTLADSLSAAADRVSETIHAGGSFDAQRDAMLADQLRAWAALAP